MATIRQYFDTDFSRVLNVSKAFRLNSGSEDFEIPVRMHYDFDSNAKFLSAFIPKSTSSHSVADCLLGTVPKLLAIGDGLEVQSSFVGEELVSCKTLKFCGRVFIYSEDEIDTNRLSLPEIALFPRFRGPLYSAERSKLEKPVAFICHDSRDKDEIARPIAYELSKLLCPVWYDEFSLKVGDPLRESIEKGSKECKKCILVLSEHFLSNPGWTKVEFNSIFTREVLEGSALFLPVWHGVNAREVYD